MKATVLGIGTIVGTHGYAPIEQMRGQVFPASDLYSLGVTCIRLLTQCLANADGSDELYDAVKGCWLWREHLPKGINISDKVGQVLDKLIQDYVKKRYQSTHEVLTVINNKTTQATTKSTVLSKPHQQNLSKAKKFTGSSLPHHITSVLTPDYGRLNDLLASARWQDANEKTFDILLNISGREKQGSLYLEDIEKLSCQDLRTIDNLWTKYSNGHFGLSIQKQIWQKSLRGNQEADEKSLCYFGTQVGWLRPKIVRKELFGNANLFFEQKHPVWFYDLTFTIKAPKGHLPCFGLLGMTLVVSLIFLRCEECGL